MSSPVQLSDLDPISTPVVDSDESLVRRAGTDYRATIGDIRNIDISGLNFISGFADPTDLMLISQAGVNYKTYFGAVGFTAGTQMWFYMNTTPVSINFWEIIPGTGDSLLAVKGGSTYTTGGVDAGSWQQLNHTLTTDEIPPHVHPISKAQNASASAVATSFLGAVGGSLPSQSTQVNITANLGHNHGNVWRPLAAVGILAQKIS